MPDPDRDDYWAETLWSLHRNAGNLAHRLNKRLFGLLIEDIPVGGLPATLTGTWQLVPLASGRDHIMLRAVLPGTHDEVELTSGEVEEDRTLLTHGYERPSLNLAYEAHCCCQLLRKRFL